MMEAAGIEPANDSDRRSGSSGRWGAEATTRTQPRVGTAAGRGSSGLEPATGQGISRALRLARRTPPQREERTARALGPGLPDPKGKVNGDADVRDKRTLSVVSGFRAQGSKQGRVCCAAELLPSP
jgi:hypothetical protein